MFRKSKQEESFETLAKSIVADLEKYVKPSALDKVTPSVLVSGMQKNWDKLKVNQANWAITSVNDTIQGVKNNTIDEVKAEALIRSELERLKAKSISTEDDRRQRRDIPATCPKDGLDRIADKYIQEFKKRDEKRNEPLQDSKQETRKNKP